MPYQQTYSLLFRLEQFCPKTLWHFLILSILWLVLPQSIGRRQKIHWEVPARIGLAWNIKKCVKNVLPKKRGFFQNKSSFYPANIIWVVVPRSYLTTFACVAGKFDWCFESSIISCINNNPSSPSSGVLAFGRKNNNYFQIFFQWRDPDRRKPGVKKLFWKSM